MLGGPRIARPGLVALLAAVVVVVAGCGSLSADELRREVQSIASTASEGSVLADQVAQQRTKRTFARVQSRALADAAEHSAERLADADPAEGVVEQARRARELAEQVSGALGDLEVTPDDATEAPEIAHRLGELAERADSLAGSL